MKRILKSTTFFVLAFALMSPAKSMAYDIFLDLGPNYQGESTDKSHPNQINVTSWSWGMTQSGTTHSGGGSGAGRAECKDLSLSIVLDKATIAIMGAASKGTHIPEALLSIRKSGGATRDFIKIKLREVIVTSVSTDGSSADTHSTANITLNFVQMDMSYTPTDKTGKPQPEVHFKWDFSQNQTF